MPHTLLLADDSITIQRVIELTFADEDVRVIAVGDGRQAITEIARQAPDIVLADVGMPGCDGYEVSAFVKGRADLAHIPVLLLTGAFEPVDEVRVRDVGANGVLAKPFEPHELIARVKELLGLPGASPAAAGGDTAGPPATAPDVGRQVAAVEPVPAEAAAAELPSRPASSAVSLDDYFDRLDAAFASLAQPPHAEERAEAPVPRPGGPPRPADAGAPASTAAPASAASPAEDRGHESVAPAKPLTPANAFAALLEAEQAAAQAGTPPAALAGLLLAPPPAPVDDVVEAVTRRVMDQLTGGAARNAVADTVSAIAERLVREEIERLKASIR